MKKTIIGTVTTVLFWVVLVGTMDHLFGMGIVKTFAVLYVISAVIVAVGILLNWLDNV